MILGLAGWPVLLVSPMAPGCVIGEKGGINSVLGTPDKI